MNCDQRSHIEVSDCAVRKEAQVIFHDQHIERETIVPEDWATYNRVYRNHAYLWKEHFLVSASGKVTVLKAGAQWQIVGVNDLGDECWATPAIAGSNLYIRTRNTLYSFGYDH